jgi:hypothetical protein
MLNLGALRVIVLDL